MNGSHPNFGAVVLAALAILPALVGGCSHNQTTLPNPFLAPDRVPPPSTRVIAPGTALPYYQGDPLPVMQSGAPAPTAAPPVAAVESPTPPIEPKQIAFSNEPSVAIPSDDDSLRFELPKPPEPAPTPAAVAATPQAAPTTAPGAGSVAPAVYNAPPANGQPAGVQTAAMSEPVVSNPWRSPQIPQTAPPVGGIAAPPLFAATTAAPPMYAPQTLPSGYVVVPPMTAPQPNVDVTLRAVPSPPPEPLESSSPRIRIPGYPAVAPAAGASPDGFRPRSSMR